MSLLRKQIQKCPGLYVATQQKMSQQGMGMTKFIHLVGGHSCLANHNDRSIIKSWAIKLLFSKYKLKHLLHVWNDASVQGSRSGWPTGRVMALVTLFIGRASEASPLGMKLRRQTYRLVLFKGVYHVLFILGGNNWNCAVFPEHWSKFQYVMLCFFVRMHT